MKKYLLFIIATLIILFACTSTNEKGNKYITAENGIFIKNGTPYYYIGTNYWYGAILGSPGPEGDRKRLLEELDMMKSLGITNLRILAGAEGPDGEPRRVSPALQTAPGEYNTNLLTGLDFLLAEMGKRDMVAILFLNNAWEWSGGFAQYLAWNGKGPIPYPETDGHTWGEFMSFSGTFHECAECKEMFHNHIRFMLTRTNSITGIPYREDPAIMSWEIANEPRAFSDKNKDAMADWIGETARLIKSLDPNHLFTTGTEGSWGCEEDISLFENIHSFPDVDYLTMHIWPFNWSWLDPKDMNGTMDKAIENTGKYMDEHLAVARKLKKPIVFEEFGLPRDSFVFTPGSPVTLRDKYYGYSFGRVLESARNRDHLAGANFWAFSGTGRPNPGREKHFWQPGDDYLGDPPQEAQGLNSVFSGDPTLDLVKDYNDTLKGLYPN